MYVELKNLNKRFGNFQASDNVGFGIEKGKLIGLLGPSGSGKTTILRLIAGLETPDSGDIFIDGQRVNDLPAAQRGIGFVFQNYALFRYMTVFDNIAFGLTVQKKDKAFIQNRVSELIRLIGLEGLEKRRPHQLSGGQKQRVAFARALAPNPHLLLLDEPFAAIDAKVRKELRTWLRETINKVGITSIFVTHDQEEAVEVADEIVITNKGRVEQIGIPVDIYRNPQTPFAAGFIGESITLSGYGDLHGFEAVSGFDRAVLRPEFVRVTKPQKEIYPHASQRGVIDEIFFRGSTLELRVNLAGQRLTAYQPLDGDAFAVGEEVSVLIYRLYLCNERDVLKVENRSIQGETAFFI
ncbi:MAG: sulfate ABC transporter ATP-binding protein [Zoogloeaceae bacterium]|jgi:sulfate transport system ATP-binding protein|nr:sulfate ABC transporter ATP-binding protein [Zoogloeaceae bacterium]